MSPSGNDTISEEIVLQYDGAEWPVSALKEKAIASYIAEGHRRGNIKNFSLYLKADERKAYYVVNGKAAGSVDFD